MTDERDTTPAVGSAASPAFGEHTGAPVALHQPAWRDGRWSYLFKDDTAYASVEPRPGAVEDANRAARTGPLPDRVQGPVMHPPVWTWQVPAYFWFGGMAAGASFIALACDVAGDRESAALARRVALGAALPCPALHIADLGRPLRFLNMLRVFKPRSPMSMGAWCLVGFSNGAVAAVAADLTGRRRVATALGAVTAVLGGYLGSYTGVLLAATAVPVWARSKWLLGPIFVCTATVTGASACRLALTAAGLPPGHPTREAIGKVEALAMGSELVLAELNQRRLGPLAGALHRGPAGTRFSAAKGCARLGLVLQLLRRPALQHAASLLYLAGALLFRLAWIEAGRESARDDRAVAETARSKRHGD